MNNSEAAAAASIVGTFIDVIMIDGATLVLPPPLALDDAPGIHLKIFFIPLESSLLNHKCVHHRKL